MKNKVFEVDSYIKTKIPEYQKDIEMYKKLLVDLYNVKNINVTNIIDKEVQNNIQELESRIKYLEYLNEFYIFDSHDIIYDIINNPQNKKSIHTFLNIATKYCYIDNNDTPQTTTNKKLIIVCSICKNRSFDVINDTTHICRNCGNQKDIFNLNPSYKDTSRMNTSSRYTYKRYIHFKDCINQYQGKQNVNINETVYNDIKSCINQYQINSGSDYTKVTKEHILIFLKECGYVNHYEDVNLIYKTITNNEIDDISYIEEALLHDFNILTDLYYKKFKQTNRILRKSFINTQYVLFQLLKKHNHPCNQMDFNILKTTDRKSLHEDIISELFNELGWNFTSLF